MIEKPLYIYFRHTPKRINFIVSRDNIGKETKSVKVIMNDDPCAGIVREFLREIKYRLGGRFDPKNRPDFGALVGAIKGSSNSYFHADKIQQYTNGKFREVIHLSATPATWERMMFVPVE